MAAPQSDPVTLSAFEASKRLTIIKVKKKIHVTATQKHKIILSQWTQTFA